MNDALINKFEQCGFTAYKIGISDNILATNAPLSQIKSIVGDLPTSDTEFVSFFGSSLGSILQQQALSTSAVAYGKYGVVDPYNARNSAYCKLFIQDRPIKNIAKALITSAKHSITFSNIDEVKVEIKNINQPELLYQLSKNITEFGVFETIFCQYFIEFAPMFTTNQQTLHHKYNVAEHTFKVMQNVINTKELKLVALLHDIGKPKAKFRDSLGNDHFHGHQNISYVMAENILKDMGNNEEYSNILKLILYHDINLNMENMNEVAKKVGKNNFPKLLAIKYADIMGQSDYKRDEKLLKLKKITDIYM